MREIEFTAEIHEGHIEVPEHLRRHFDRPVHVKVTLLPEGTADEDEVDMIEHLLLHPLKIDGPFLTRDQAHERDR